MKPARSKALTTRSPRTHPFSRAKFNAGSEHFAADALLAAACFAKTEAEATAIAQRLAPALTVGNTDDWDVDLRARTVIVLERLHPTDLTSAFQHPAAKIRATATMLWAERPDRPPNTAHQLAADPDRRVRYVLATALVALSATEQNAYADILTALAADPSHLVRSALDPT